MRFPNANKILKTISEANHLFAEMVTLHFITRTDCPDCGFDPVRKESLDPNCKTCGGSGLIETDNPLTIPVSFETPEDVGDIFQFPIGSYDEDTVFITIDKREMDQYNLDEDVVKSKVSYFTHNGVDYVLRGVQASYLDGVKYEIVCKLVRRK